MARTYPAMNALCGWNRFCAIIAGAVGVVASIVVIAAGDLLTACGCLLAGVMGLLSFMATAEMIQLAISAGNDLDQIRHDLGDVRLHLLMNSRREQEPSEISKPDDVQSLPSWMSPRDPESTEPDA